MPIPWIPAFRVSQLIVVIALAVSLLIASLVALQVTNAEPPCPCTVFSATDPMTQPGVYANGGGIEVGFKFQVQSTGYITGIRFYKVAGMAGTHTASLWDRNGNRLTQATFQSESAAGWQQVTFAPIPVTKSPSLYTASVFMADGNYTATSGYFNASITDSIFYVLENNSAVYDGFGNNRQGMYNASGTSAYPRDSFNAANYWVDVMYVHSTDSTPPVVTARAPADTATNVPVTNAVTATFNKAMMPSSVTSDSLVVKDQQGGTIAGTVSYDDTTTTVKFISNTLWNTGATYTATIKASSGLRDKDGIAIASDESWTFTTSVTPAPTCPCSFENNQTPVSSLTYEDVSPNGLELGMKVIPDANGYIRAIRFYKPIISTATTHTGNIWSSTGSKLATATTVNESSYGWQDAVLSTPLSVRKDQTYIISFGVLPAVYQATFGGLVTTVSSGGMSKYPSGDARNTATGSGTANGVYTTTAGAYPSLASFNNTTYHIDAVFAYDTVVVDPLKVVTAQPSADSYGVVRTASISASFNRALDPSTVNGATVTVKRGGTAVSGVVSYDAANHAVVFAPTTTLAYGMAYTVTLSGGISDSDGRALTNPHTWTFTTGSPLSTDMNQGAGGPILVVTSAGDSYGNYYAEILRTEGFTYFSVADKSALTSAMLNEYKTVILSQAIVTDDQVNMLSTWVSNGGNLIAMRPDKKLAGLLGLIDKGGLLTNKYMRVDNATAPGIGIVNETMQYKGVADTYQADGATVVATLYEDATSTKNYPAVTTRAVGAGTAMSFSYDLARSVIGLHQGNQSWAGQNRDADQTIRSNDLFYGAMTGDTQTDWLDPAKMAIPQADEQQRLLANLITDGMKDNLPAPRFWYLPNEQKAALVMTGDDHDMVNSSGTEMTMNNLLNASPLGCSVMDWQCVRASHYTYPTSALTNARAGQYIAHGFEIGSHPNNGCGLARSLQVVTTDTAASFAYWRAKYTVAPPQVSSRFHCYVWFDWDTTPLVDVATGVRYDLNSVAFPATWVGTNSPMVTGSGMNMRLTDARGALLDVRQGVTNFDNTSAGPVSIAAMFDNALGATGYYGLFGSHYDMGDTYDKTLLSIAKSRHIPIISAAQALTWLDGRNSSTFSNLASNQPGKVSFAIAAAEGAHGLQAMVPLDSATGPLLSITSGGQAVSYRDEIIKGVNYAIFAAVPGDYVVSYKTPAVAVPTSQLATGQSGQVLGVTSQASSGRGVVIAEMGESSEGIVSPAEPTASVRTDASSNSPYAQELSSQTTADNGVIAAVAGIGVVVVTASAATILVIRRRLRG